MLWLIAAATAAVSVPGTPPLPPHVHYEIRINKVSHRRLTDAERLQSACDLAYGVAARVRSQTKADLILAFDLAMLRNVTCDKPNSN